jgi:hypothetical protein
MKTLRSLLAVATVVVIGLTSCSKGSTGPAGNAGPIGPAGPDSVVYSAWISLNFTYDPVDTAFGDTLSAPSLTKAILDSGVILTYVNFQEQDGTYHIVPVSGLSSILIEDYSVGQINIVAGNDFTGLPYRYVTIPGTMLARTSSIDKKIKGYTIQELKAMPFEQVQQVLSGTKN